METKFSKLLQFLHIVAPTQRAAGGCSPIKVTPGRGPTVTHFFGDLGYSNRKMNDFYVECINILMFFQSDSTLFSLNIIKIIT